MNITTLNKICQQIFINQLPNPTTEDLVGFIISEIIYISNEAVL